MIQRSTRFSGPDHSAVPRRPGNLGLPDGEPGWCHGKKVRWVDMFTYHNNSFSSFVPRLPPKSSPSLPTPPACSSLTLQTLYLIITTLICSIVLFRFVSLCSSSAGHKVAFENTYQLVFDIINGSRPRGPKGQS